MEIKQMNCGQVALQLIEDTLTDNQYVGINGIFLEKNAINEEATHSYYAKVVYTCENSYGIKEGDVVYLNKMYSRTLVKDDVRGNILVTLFSNIIARVPDFDIGKFLKSEEMTIVPLGNKCLIEPTTNKGEDQYKDVALPGVGSREQKFARVIAKGEEVDNCNYGINVDDYVIMYCDTGTYVKFNNKTLQIINCSFLLCVIDDMSTSFNVTLNRG